jgi:hypothetical protein
MDERQVLLQARNAIQRKDKKTAQRLLYQAVRRYPKSETAWLWLSALVDDPQQELDCLNKVLEINPNNETARRHWLKLQSSVPIPQSTQPEQPEQLEKLGRPPKKRRTKHIWTLIAVIVGLIVILCVATIVVPSVMDGIRQARMTPTPTRVPVNGMLMCEDCAEAGILISLWEQPGSGSFTRGKVVGSLAHRTAVTIHDQKFSPQESRFYYLVSGNGQKGWIQEPFVLFSSARYLRLYDYSGGFVTLYGAPPSSSDVVGRAENGKAVTLLETVVLTSTGEVRYKVKVSDTGTVGWVEQGHISLWKP